MESIFEELPRVGWGSRGNPCFWNYLKERLPENLTADNIEDWIKEEHLKLTGEELTEDSSVYVEEFAEGGMSSGIITGDWWIVTGIPILKSRI